MTESSPSSTSKTDNSRSSHQPLPPLGSAPVTAETLRHFRVFADLEDAQRERLFSQMHPLTVPARTILLAAGQPGHAVYFLLEGTVKIGLERPTGPRTQKAFSIGKKEPKEPVAPATSAQATGAQVMLSLCGPGAVLGEMSLLDGLGHSASVTARETCRLLWMDKDAFLQAMEEMPSLPYALLRECSARLRDATYQLHAYATLDAAGRIAHALLRLGARFGIQTRGGENPENEAREGENLEDVTPERLRLDIGLTFGDLADLTGMTRARVNQVLVEFKRNDSVVVTQSGEIVGLDTPNLLVVAKSPVYLSNL